MALSTLVVPPASAPSALSPANSGIRGNIPPILDGSGENYRILISRLPQADFTAFLAALRDAAMMLLVEFPGAGVLDAFTIELRYALIP